MKRRAAIHIRSNQRKLPGHSIEEGRARSLSLRYPCFSSGRFGDEVVKAKQGLDGCPDCPKRHECRVEQNCRKLRMVMPSATTKGALLSSWVLHLVPSQGKSSHKNASPVFCTAIYLTGVTELSAGITAITHGGHPRHSRLREEIFLRGASTSKYWRRKDKERLLG